MDPLEVELIGMSKQRRRFLLFCGFDVGLVTLMWIIYTVQNGGHFRDEIDLRNSEFFKESLFDVVILSSLRVVWLLLLYGVLNMQHWVFVGFSTISTAACLVLKILYFFVKTRHPIAFAIIICSFVLSWIELYLMPFSVVRTERRQQRIAEEGLVRNTAPTASDDLDERYFSMAQNGEDSASSGNEEVYGISSGSNTTAGKKRNSSESKDVKVYRPFTNVEYVNVSLAALSQGQKWHALVASWTQKCKEPCIKCHKDKQYGKIWYLKLDLRVPASTVFKVLYTQIDRTPSWNKAVAQLRIILKVDDRVDVTYSVSTPAAKNLITPRDFVDVRRFDHDASAGAYVISGQTVYSTVCSPTPKYIRAENGPNMWCIRPDQHDSNKCTLEWIMNTNLKGGLPKRLVDSNLKTFLLNYAKSLTTHVIALEKK